MLLSNCEHEVCWALNQNNECKKCKECEIKQKLIKTKMCVFNIQQKNGIAAKSSD